MNAISGLVKGGAWLAVGNIVAKLASTISLPILSRILTPELLGIYSIVFSTAQSAEGFSTLGIDIAMQRNGAQYETTGTESVGRLFGVGLSLICLVSAIVSIGIWVFRYPIAQHWLGKPDMAIWLGISALLSVLQSFSSVLLQFLSSLRDFRAYALRSSAEIVFASVATVLLAKIWGIKGAVLGLVVTAILKIPWSYLVARSALRRKGIKLRIDKFWQESLSIFKFGFPYYFGNTMLGSLVSLPLMGLVSQYGGLPELGYLRVSQSMAALVGFIPTAIAPAAMSYLSASSASDSNSYQYLRSMHLRTVWILLLLPTCGVSFILPDIINFLFGSAYKQAVVLSWLSLWITLLAGISTVLIQYLVVTGRTMRVSWASSLFVIVWIGTASYLVPYYSSLGFLISQGIGQIVGLIFVAYPVIIDMSFRDKKLLKKILLASFTLSAISFMVAILKADKYNQLFSYSLSFCLTVFTGIFLFKNALYHDEKIKLVRVIKSALSKLISE